VRGFSILIDGASFGPATLKVIGQAFDEAWAEIARNFGDNPTQIEHARLRPAEALLSIAAESGTLGYSVPGAPSITAANFFSNTDRSIGLGKSALAGVQVGWNWQAGLLVAGVEADMSYVGAKGEADAIIDVVACPNQPWPGT
jgi:hypothetical protein